VKSSTELIRMGGYRDVIGEKAVKTVNPPVYTGSTVLFETYRDMVDVKSGNYPGVTYGTDRMPNQLALEDAICRLEGGYLTRAFPSGISAIRNTLLAFLESGDHLLVVENIYAPTAHFCKAVLSKFNIRVDRIPAAVGDDIENYIRPETKLIFLESPGSNTFEIQDIPAVTKVARKKGILTLLDSSWATPLFLKPFDLGVDIVLQSVTKYMTGHSDVLLGSVSVNQSCARHFAKMYRAMEIYAPSRECSLGLRGLKTLPVRLKQHEAAGIEVSRWLETLDIVERVLHPALAGHPQHHIWKRDFSGASGLFSFTFKEDYPEEKIAAFIDALELFGIGFSWGGFKSLITAGKYPRESSPELSGKTVIRLNIGLEDVEDLKRDLEIGLGKLAGTPVISNR